MLDNFLNIILSSSFSPVNFLVNQLEKPNSFVNILICGQILLETLLHVYVCFFFSVLFDASIYQINGFRIIWTVIDLGQS